MTAAVIERPGAELASLRRYCPGAELWEEGGLPLVFLPRLKVVSAGEALAVDALLCPRARDSYLTRLFFSQQLPASGNWSAYTIMTRSWFAISWQGVPADAPWLEILAMHLEAVK